MPETHDLALRRAEYDAGLQRRKRDLITALDRWRGKEADEYEESEKVIDQVIKTFNEGWKPKNHLSLKRHGRAIFKCLTLTDHLAKVRPYTCTCDCAPCQDDSEHVNCTGDDYGDHCYDDNSARPLPGFYRAKTPESEGGPSVDPYHRPAVEYWRGYWTQDRDMLMNEITAYKEPRP
ncbi:hypothetical protein SALGADO_96 [Arthrobacter phage Salgado]|uniref:Uncharacterized protein n=2 Tax=Laroyevirus TaxID=1982086 RepID=A0A0U4JDZ9_9CAUD|nr:hypothetical protein KMD21_gp93 [Arthrobacter phage LiSara]YP_010082705.1 hypothetical protein KMD22_gp96 [Arthrobacter phage Salgado]ALY10261.1 hypothetical protein SALGADO_96 [Arthrobacter phage Salgado]ASR83676.1 hypothetical protein SEA_LISARA_93 [Arthrobacter phage LiSara]